MTKISADSDDAVVASGDQNVNETTGVAAEAGYGADTEASPQLDENVGSNADSEQPAMDMEATQPANAPDMLSSEEPEQVPADSTAVSGGPPMDIAQTDGQPAEKKHSAETS